MSEVEMVTDPFTYYLDVAAEVDPPTDGTLSRTLYQDARLKVVLFGFAAGQELSEHTAATPAIMHFLRGEAEVTLGDKKFSVQSGSWIHMTPQLPHSIRAQTPAVMILLLLK
jgi:quercetin dioxygenase-like cupin family protein